MSGEWGDLLRRELRPVSAPPGMWGRVEAALDAPPAWHQAWQPARRPLWMLAAAMSLAVCALPLVWKTRVLDLGSYLAPVQAASPNASASAIAQAPPHFETVSGAGRAGEVAGYQVTAWRVAHVRGETVQQVVLTAAGNAVALFISSPKIRLDAGANRWVDGNVDGLACKRLNCPRVRTAQFPCFQQTCVLICKACSDRALSALMSGVGDIR